MKTLSLASVLAIAAVTVGGAVAPSAMAGDDLAQSAPDLAAGKKVYEETCIACHGPDGKGAVPGTPDFTKMDGVLAKEPDKVLLSHILNGFQAPGAPMAMPPKGGNEELTIKDLNDVLAYLHQHFHYKKY